MVICDKAHVCEVKNVCRHGIPHEPIECVFLNCDEFKHPCFNSGNEEGYRDTECLPVEEVIEGNCEEIW